MILDSVNKSLELILGSAVTTTAMPVTVDYVDMTSTTTLAGSSDSQSNGVTLVTILAAPAASTQRKVNALTVYNADTVAKVVTIRLNNNTVLRNLVVITLQVGETLGYSDTGGWYVLTTGGNRKEGVSIAADIANTPAGNIASTTVQAALNELDSEKSPLAGSTSIVTTGALNVGSITSGFGSIDIGADSLTAGSATFSTPTNSISIGSAGAYGTIHGDTTIDLNSGSIYINSKTRGGASGSNTASGCVSVFTNETFRYCSAAAVDRAIFSSTGLAVTGTVSSNLATTATAANMVSTADGTAYLRSTSSLKYKRDVETLDVTFADKALELRPVWYHSKAAADKQEWSYYGLIAEEVALVEPRLVHWAHRDMKQELISPEVLPVTATFDAEGVELTPAIEAKAAQYKTVIDTDSPLIPDGVQYERLSVLLLDVVKRQQVQITAMESRLAALEAV